MEICFDFQTTVQANLIVGSALANALSAEGHNDMRPSARLRQTMSERPSASKSPMPATRHCGSATRRTARS